MSRTNSISVAKSARAASRVLCGTSLECRDFALTQIRSALVESKSEILDANRLDLENCGDSDEALVKRLRLTEDKYDALLSGLEDVIKLADPLHKVTLKRELTEGLVLTRVSCPIGVLCVIFEARPEAGVQILSLTIKSGNALILKGGKEASKSNNMIFSTIRRALETTRETFPNFPVDAIQLVDTRDEIAELLDCNHDIDLVIPRGSNALVRYIQENTKIPVLGHADGICHIYVDEEVKDIDEAIRIVVDAKTSYPAGCNAAECLLIHEKMAPKFLGLLRDWKHGINFHADETALGYLEGCATLATEEDWGKEFLSNTMAVKVVADVKEAIEYINSRSSRHTEAILTSIENNADLFKLNIDSSSVYVNCSTRFADGYRYGFGAEVGISTAKIHSRGPVGVEGLLIYKYLMQGSGHCVTEMGSKRQYTFVDLPL